MKKIEIIERITDANGSISENILTSWEHKNQLIPKIIRFEELKIYLQELLRDGRACRKPYDFQVHRLELKFSNHSQ